MSGSIGGGPDTSSGMPYPGMSQSASQNHQIWQALMQALLKKGVKPLPGVGQGQPVAAGGGTDPTQILMSILGGGPTA
jgi:hypothetical protein